MSLFRAEVRDLVSRLATPVVFVDVGSRNGVLDLADIAESVEAWGFEPNPAEYAKLDSGRTDAASFGIRSPAYRALRYAPYALFDREGTHPFYVTKGPGACGLLEPDVERLREIRWKGRLFPRNFGDDVFEVKEVVDVPVRTLGAFASEHGVRFIDYLKIDVEGAEYEVLAGAGDLLSSVGVIKVEVCFIPFRRGQKLFSHVDLLLRDKGFDLLRYETTAGQIGFKERDRSLDWMTLLDLPDRGGQPLSTDAIYVNRTLSGRDRLAAQAAILALKGYRDEALHVLRRKLDAASLGAAPLVRALEERERSPWARRAVKAALAARRFIAG